MYETTEENKLHLSNNDLRKRNTFLEDALLKKEQTVDGNCKSE